MKKTKQTTLSMLATTSANNTNSYSTNASSGTSFYSYPPTISGSSVGWNLNTKPSPLTEEQEIEITLLDGTKVTMLLIDYFQFLTYNKMVPSDCKDLDEFNEKMLVFRI